MTGDPVFELRGATRRYGSEVALREVDLRIAAGERVALAGPSGAGKTTLINLLNATLAPSEGSVRLFGRDVTELSAGELRRLQRRIGTIYQQFHLVGPLKVIHNVNAGRLGEWSWLRAAWSLIRPQGEAGARRALRRVGLEGKLFQRTDSLSGGEQQRVALSRVLLQDPDAVLADEPIASLDRENSRAVMDLIRDLSAEGGRTAVLSLHDINYALSHCQRVVGLRDGRVLFDVPSGDVTGEMMDELYELEGVPGTL